MHTAHPCRIETDLISRRFQIPLNLPFSKGGFSFYSPLSKRGAGGDLAFTLLLVKEGLGEI